MNLNRYFETAVGGFVSAYNITVGFIGLKWAALSQFLASVSPTHSAVNAWLSTISLMIGITAGILTIRNMRKKQ